MLTHCLQRSQDVKWNPANYTACNAHATLPLQKDAKWRSGKNHRAFQMWCFQIEESGRQVSSWQLHYGERILAVCEVHGAVIPHQTSFLEPQGYSPSDPGSLLPHIPSTARGLAHLCRYQTATPFSISSRRIQLPTKLEMLLPATTGPGHPSTLQYSAREAQWRKCRDHEPFPFSRPIITLGSASVGTTTGYYFQLCVSGELPALLGSACLSFPSGTPFLWFWSFDPSCLPLFIFPSLLPESEAMAVPEFNSLWWTSHKYN